MGFSAGNATYMRPAVKKMMALMTPTIHSSLPLPLIPNSLGKDKLAPLDPVWSHPCVAAPTAHRETEYQSMKGPCHLWSLSYSSAWRSCSSSAVIVSMCSGSRATRAARPNRAACSAMSCDSAQARASTTAFSWELRCGSEDDQRRCSIWRRKVAERRRLRTLPSKGSQWCWERPTVDGRPG